MAGRPSVSQPHIHVAQTPRSHRRSVVAHTAVVSRTGAIADFADIEEKEEDAMACGVEGERER